MSKRIIPKWLKNLPKIELHAHLFGSITQKQLLDLLNKKGLEKHANEFYTMSKNLNLDLIFQKAFSFLPLVIKNRVDLIHLTKTVISNFIEDNVIYLELRSSPKKLIDCDEVGYIESIIEGIKSLESNICTRLIVSINRDYPPKYFEGLIDKITQAGDSKKYVVGLDFAGNPLKNSFKEYRSILESARKQGFKITIHTPETLSQIAEVSQMLDFWPNRLGHFVFYEEKNLKEAIEKKIPIEICPSSNFVAHSNKKHPFVDLLTGGLEHYTVCTDDLLLFSANLSEEWALFMDKTGVNRKVVTEKQLKIVDYIFDENVKSQLKEKINRDAEKFLLES